MNSLPVIRQVILSVNDEKTHIGCTGLIRHRSFQNELNRLIQLKKLNKTPDLHYFVYRVADNRYRSIRACNTLKKAFQFYESDPLTRVIVHFDKEVIRQKPKII